MSDTFFNNRNKALALAGVVVLFALIAAKGLGGSSTDETAENPELAVVEDQAPKPSAPAQPVAGWADAGQSDDWGRSEPDADWGASSSSGNNSEIDVGNVAADRESGTFASNARRSGSNGSDPRITSGAARNAPQITAPDSNGRGGGSLTVE